MEMRGARVVTRLPISALWRDGREVQAHRVGAAGDQRVRELLRASDVRFAIANVGDPLAWFDDQACFGVWKSELCPRLVDPSDARIDLDRYPGGRCYFASEWRDAHGCVIVLFEKRH
jgi:hypothetical protein